MTQRVVVLGGGTAGWLSAGLLAAELQGEIFVTLIESPDVATIGVGEGTWPSMRNTLKKIGLSETDFIRRCSASFKQGSAFVGWRNGNPDDIYYHPFTLPYAKSMENMAAAWLEYSPSHPYASSICVQPIIAEQFLSPKTIQTPEYSGVLNYGYHLNAGAFAELLKEHCINRLGVNYISAHVADIASDDMGYITALKLVGSQMVEGDFFIDCSGTHAKLIGDFYQVPFVDMSRYSTNDRALAVQVPYENENEKILSVTRSTAQSAGWIWDIGLSNRRGIGHVYSSQYINKEQAESELRNYLLGFSTKQKVDSLSVKELQFEPGYRQSLWKKNCLAIGMASGFIEPLEASALAMVELSARWLVDNFPRQKTVLPILEKKFNDLFHYRWQKIIEFLKLHYVLSARNDTPYWMDHRNADAIPDGLKELLELWDTVGLNSSSLLHAEEVFPLASYEYIYYGMKSVSDIKFTARKSDLLALGMTNIKEINSIANKLQTKLPMNRDILNSLKNRAFPQI